MTIATAGGLGIAFTPNDREVFNRNGATATIPGDLVQFNILRTGTETTDGSYGLETSCWANTIVPTGTAGMMIGGMYAVVKRGAADNLKHVVQVSGKVDAKVTNDNGAGVLPVGSFLYAGNDLELHGHSTLQPGRKILAILQTQLGNGATSVVEVDFDGIHGFGSTSVT